jgi:hypothetical protein
MYLQRASKASARGILLFDLLVYISLLAFILILSAVVFEKFLDQSAALRRNISDIDRAMKAGERWRADVRSATGAPQLNGNTMIIPQPNGDLVYELGPNVTRKRPSSDIIEPVLNGVRTNQMIFEQRTHAAVWRWEVELDHRRKNARVRPLFTFIAVAGSNETK